MKFRAPIFVCVFFASLAALSADSLDELADKLLTPRTVSALKGRDISLISANDAISADFARILSEKISAFAVVVYTDKKIIQGEIDRQMSGLVDDNEIAAIGHQRGADIVVQVILCRVAREKPGIKALLTAVHVETSTLAASSAVEAEPPRGIDINRLPLQKESETDEVRRMTLAIVNSKAGAIHDDPIPPPKVSRAFFDINWRSNYFLGASALLDFLVLSNASGEVVKYGMRLVSLEYGRLGESWLPQNRVVFGISPLMLGAFGYGFDVNAGYRLFSRSHAFPNWTWLYTAISAGGGIMLVTDNADLFLPYLYVKFNAGPFHLAVRFYTFESTRSSVQIGFSMLGFF